jgi:D-alanyl-D-alanine carboxypeptidase
VETGAPGATAAIVRDGVLIFIGASGEAARSPSRPLGTTSLLSLAGVTEMATAAMVLRLREEGRLSLEDSLARYVPYVPGADRITVGMLLAHRAGLPDYQSLSFGELYYSFQDPTHVWTRAEILRAIGPEDDLRPPGQGYRYSQTDYVALGAVLEQASGMGVDAFFERFIAAPLGLDRCLFNADPALAPEVSQSFAYDSAKGDYVSTFPANGSVPTYLWGPVWTDSGIMCSAEDTARFTDALLGGKLVSPATLALMTAFGTEGYGLGVARRTDSGRVSYGHAGSRGGYGAAAWYDPERRLTIVVLVNADGPSFLAETVFQRMEEAYNRSGMP